MGKYFGAVLCFCIVLLAASVCCGQYADLDRKQTKEAIKEQLKEFDNPTEEHGRYKAGQQLEKIHQQSRHGYLVLQRRYLGGRLIDQEKFNGLVRLNAAILFAKLQDVGSARLLITALKDPNAGVRYWAVVALGRIKAKEAVQPLIKLLDDDVNIRMRSIEALGEIGCVEAVGPLMKILGGSKQPAEIEKAIITALRNITGESFGYRVTSSQEKIVAAIKQWENFWNNKKAEIEKLIKDGNCKMN